MEETSTHNAQEKNKSKKKQTKSKQTQSTQNNTKESTGEGKPEEAHAPIPPATTGEPLSGSTEQTSHQRRPSNRGQSNHTDTRESKQHATKSSHDKEKSKHKNPRKYHTINDKKIKKYSDDDQGGYKDNYKPANKEPQVRRPARTQSRDIDYREVEPPKHPKRVHRKNQSTGGYERRKRDSDFDAPSNPTYSSNHDTQSHSSRNDKKGTDGASGLTASPSHTIDSPGRSGSHLTPRSQVPSEMTLVWANLDAVEKGQASPSQATLQIKQNTSGSGPMSPVMASLMAQARYKSTQVQ